MSSLDRSTPALRRLGLTSALALLSVASFGAPARAQLPPPVPWELTGTSTSPLPEVGVTHRLERRRFEKRGRFITRAGLSYLSRGDFYSNPGVSAEVAWYPEENIGLDLVSTTIYFSTLNSTAEALRKSTGLLPDSQKPVARITTGARLAFAYGKLLIEALDTVIHFDASLDAHLGVLITSETANAGGDLGLSFQVVTWDRLLVWMSVSYFASYEKRTSSNLAGGPQGSLGAGVVFP